MSAHPDLVPPAAVLAAFDLEPTSLERATSGLMNPTWYVSSRRGAPLVLQRVNPIFSAEVNIDIAAVTTHLARKGLLTPRLVPTSDGALWFEHDGVWRVLTRIEGVCRDALETPAQAGAAGRIVAQFHRAVSDLDHRFRNRRLGVHDTPRHLRTLRELLVEQRGHRHFDVIEPLAERVLETAAALPPLPASPDRIVHGDPKISNLHVRARRRSGAVPHRPRHARAHAGRARARRRIALLVQPRHRRRRQLRASCGRSSTLRSAATPKPHKAS